MRPNRKKFPPIQSVVENMAGSAIKKLGHVILVERPDIDFMNALTEKTQQNPQNLQN